LPNENYVGQTKGVKKRISQHKTDGKDTSDYKMLHTFETRKEASTLKKLEYHSNGYK
jgi:predicted GIY-YIG superfamily endonuclease